MAERALRGTSIGSKSLETEDGVVFAARKQAIYLCPNGHRQEKIFAAEANPPLTWDCRCGLDAELQNEGGNEDENARVVKPVRTHWDMLVERRTPEELDQLLQEHLDILREGALTDGVHYRH